MLGKSANQNQYNLFKPLLKEFIGPSHKLVKLADAVDWKSMEKTFAPLYPNIGSRAKPVRLVAGLLILKQIYNLSDEALVASFVSNPYFQYFCRVASFKWRPPCDPSDLVHFRKPLDPEGVIEELFKQSVALFQQNVKQSKTALVYSTV